MGLGRHAARGKAEGAYLNESQILRVGLGIVGGDLGGAPPPLSATLCDTLDTGNLAHLPHQPSWRLRSQHWLLRRLLGPPVPHGWLPPVPCCPEYINQMEYHAVSCHQQASWICLRIKTQLAGGPVAELSAMYIC